MKDFIRPIEKTIFGRIQNADLSYFENEIRKYILINYISKGIAPEINDLSELFKISEKEIILVLEKLNRYDVINFKDNKIICSYPFSDKTTEFIVKIDGKTRVYALCATDAFGIHFLTKENCLIESKCPYCKADIQIELKEGNIKYQKPDEIIEFVSLPENCGCTSESFCPTIKFFCSNDHINSWKLAQNYDFNGEIYHLTEVAYHSKMIFSDLFDM